MKSLSKDFKYLTANAAYRDDTNESPEVSLEDKENGWKYNITVYAKPEVVAAELRRVATWLETTVRIRRAPWTSVKKYLPTLEFPVEVRRGQEVFVAMLRSVNVEKEPDVWVTPDRGIVEGVTHWRRLR